MADLFLSCDWGTTSFRLVLADLDGAILRKTTTDRGTAELADAGPDGFRGYLDERVVEFLEDADVRLADGPEALPIWISGMAGSSIGWKEVPYATVPFSLDGASGRIDTPGVVSKGRPHPVYLVGGLRTRADVLRGEETQALGAFALLGKELSSSKAVIIFSGTHSKHVRIAGGAIDEFSTSLTGELFDLLSRRSILRHSVREPPGAPLSGPALEPFREGVELARDVPLSTALFRVRARQLLDGHDRDANSAFLSGLLIGAELAGSRLVREALAEGAPGAAGGLRLVIAGAEPVAKAYARAVEILFPGLHARTLSAGDVEQLVPRGHALLRKRHAAGVRRR